MECDRKVCGVGFEEAGEFEALTFEFLPDFGCDLFKGFEFEDRFLLLAFAFPDAGDEAVDEEGS